MHATIDPLIASRQDQPGALLPLLHDVQDALGYIPSEAVARVAAALNLSRAEVHGVVTFYHHFKTEPQADTVVQICRAEACRSMGSEQLWQHACQSLQVDPHAAAHGATSADQNVSLQPVYCLGLCSSAPAMQVNARLHARVDADKFDQLVRTEGKLA